jgi:putative ABC transport system permease protein
VVGLALLISLLTGLVSGFLPAWRAARMNPVDALRSE